MTSGMVCCCFSLASCCDALLLAYFATLGARANATGGAGFLDAVALAVGTAPDSQHECHS